MRKNCYHVREEILLKQIWRNKMEAYKSFARVYDMFMDNIPYSEWCGYLIGILEEFGITDGILLDLGCGTGSLTELLAAKGYDMIGVIMQKICWRSP